MSDCRPSFGGGTDSNSTRHHLHHSKNKRHYDVLTSSRYEDVKETFSEEFHETGYRRRKRNYSEERLTDSEDELDTAKEKDDLKTWEPETSDKGAQLLAKMGYGGGGLGKSGQGREEPIPLSSQHGRVGLGYSVNKALTRDLNVKWDEQQEDKSYEEEVIWISASDRIRENFLDHISKDWVQEGERKLLIDDETSFCDETLLKDMLHAKSLFDELKDYELRKARARANPFETIGSVFFQNRAAVKAANIDRLTNWLMTDENPETMERKTPLDPKQKRINTDRPRPLFYFADVCAGPGGFSEYVLWRKGFYNARGFGFTLKGKDDFKLDSFNAASPMYFHPHYGSDGTGDVTKPQNILDFERVVKCGTDGTGVDLMMADGGFSVEGQENIQEILSKQLYLCQFLVALSIVRPRSDHRPGGNFFCKLFDLFTPFSAGLVYCLYVAFRQISLHKPRSSRPANSERYVLCKDLSEEGATTIKNYLTEVNNEIDRLHKQDPTRDVTEVVPFEILSGDDQFLNYIMEHNERLIKRQTQYLNKYRAYVQNQTLIDLDQSKLREECLRYWKLPDLPKSNKKNQREYPPDVEFAKICSQLVDFSDLKKPSLPFTENVLSCDNEKRIRYAELRLGAISEDIGACCILFTNSVGRPFCRCFDDVTFVPANVESRIPRNSILFVERTKYYQSVQDCGKNGRARPAIRILDAAVIDGDDLTDLSYESRIKATEKMCRAIDVVEQDHCSASAWKRSKVTVVNILKFDELRHQMERFKTSQKNGRENAWIKEGDVYYQCRGMRVISILKDPWVMCWSNSSKAPYVFNKVTKESNFCNCPNSETRSGKFYSDFWSTFMPRQHGSHREENQWIWQWHSDSGSAYGPHVVLRDDESEHGPTMRSIAKIVKEQMK